MILELVLKLCEAIFGFKVRFMLLNKKRYKVISNINLKSTDGEKIHMDYIVVSQYGIFIINVLKLHGKVYGNENEEYWKSVYRKQENTFKNPKKQIAEFVKSLQNVINKDKISKVNFIPIIVFRKAKFDLICSNANVIRSCNMIPVIKRYRYISKISHEAVTDIIRQVMAANIF